MADLEHNPEYWRARAEEARAMADSMRDATVRGHMISVAETYDRIAALTERHRMHLVPKVASGH